MQPSKPNSSLQVQVWAFAGKGVPQYWVGLALIFIGIYFAWFYLQPVDGGIRRLDRFILLLLPTDVLNMTIGGGAAHLQVGIVDRFIPLSLTALWMAVSWWIGRPGIQRIASELSRLEVNCLSCLLGLSLLSTSTLLLGLAGWLNRPTLVSAVVALSLVSLVLQQLRRSSSNSRATQSIPPEQVYFGQAAAWMWRLIPVAVGLLVAMYVAGGCMPPFEFDAVEYHMQAPREFFQKGRIDFVEHNVYANMPLGIEMHSLAAMVLVGGHDGWWLGGITGNCIICMFSLLAAGIASGYAARYFGRRTGWATAATLLSAPGNILVSGCGLVDSAMGAYLLAAVVCLQVWREKRIPLNTETAAIPSSPILACLFAGTAAACKYTGLVFACVPTLLFVLFVAYPDLRRWPAIKLVLVATLVCLATLTPWIAKNSLWTANPVYPLASQLFGSGNLTEQQNARWTNAHQVPKSSSGSAYDWPSLKASALSLAGKSEYLPAVLIPLVCIGFFVSRPSFFRHPASLPLIYGAWVLLVWWLATHRIDRFWLPALPLFSIVAATGIRWLLIRSQSAAVALCLLITLIYAAVASISGAYTDSRWFVSYDSLRKDFGTEETPGRLPKTIGWINSNLPADSKILSIGEARAFLFEHPLLYATCFNTPPGEYALNQASPEDQSKWLAQNGISHLLVQWNEIERYRSPGNYGFSHWPKTSDINAMIDTGVVRRVAEWPFQSQSAELLEVNRNYLRQKVDDR